MKRQRILTLLALCSAAFVATLPAQEAPQELPSQAEMWKMIQAQQKQIEALSAMVQANQTEVSTTRTELATAKTEAASAKAEASTAIAQLKATQQQVEATTIAVEEIGDSAFNMPAWYNNTSIGGYGELHANFNNGADNEIDFHRFVLFFNHEFNDWISLFSELELEHSIAGDDQDGEIELEQAYIRMDWTEQFNTDAGVFLLPVGILNETHEPNTFYGVERNNVEKYIIPSTWWEGGIKGTYRTETGLTFDGTISSGMDLDGADGYIRSGRQKVSKATNDEAALAGRVKYTGIAGLEIAASVLYQDDLDQSTNADYSGLLSTTHIAYTTGGFSIRALYARWDLDGDIASDAEEQYGYYIEPSYRWELSEKYGDLGIYARFSDYEYFYVKDSKNISELYENKIYEVGVNYWPTDNVVFKLDYQDTNDADQYQKDGIDSVVNLGVGYQF
jgi:hypothetical protein